jgi:hypothetical protein
MFICRLAVVVLQVCGSFSLVLLLLCVLFSRVLPAERKLESGEQYV